MNHSFLKNLDLKCIIYCIIFYPPYNLLTIKQALNILPVFMCLEAGKGGITVRDIQKMAIEHDFIWSEKEFADMVYFFDSNGDGKVSIFVN